MKVSLAILAVLGSSLLTQAQTAPHTPPTPAAMAQRQVQRYATLLTLNSAQVEQATTLFTTEATSRHTARASEHAAHQALEAAVKANDAATIQSTAATLGQMETESVVAHATARAQFYALLTADQKAKLTELEGEHMMGGPEHDFEMRPH
jgi:Spy/CpxP family protein refolding chaperone